MKKRNIFLAEIAALALLFTTGLAGCSSDGGDENGHNDLGGTLPVELHGVWKGKDTVNNTRGLQFKPNKAADGILNANKDGLNSSTASFDATEKSKTVTLRQNNRNHYCGSFTYRIDVDGTLIITIAKNEAKTASGHFEGSWERVIK